MSRPYKCHNPKCRVGSGGIVNLDYCTACAEVERLKAEVERLTPDLPPDLPPADPALLAKANRALLDQLDEARAEARGYRAALDVTLGGEGGS